MRPSTASYTPLNLESKNNEDGPTPWSEFLRGHIHRAALLFFMSSTLILVVLLTRSYAARVDQSSSYAFAPVSERWTQYNWWSTYSSPHPSDRASIEAAWDAIVPAHGIVAVDHQWAAERQLPQSIDLPDNPKQGVYIIDAYHQLHCLTIVRKTFYEIERKQPLTYPLGHSMHCFDSIRQYVMCTAGDTLLYSWGLNSTGDGQYRKCKDWGALRDWATQHTACYRDSEIPIPLDDHYGHCDDGSDGLKSAG